jgi:hypothetical protein
LFKFLDVPVRNGAVPAGHQRANTVRVVRNASRRPSRNDPMKKSRGEGITGSHSIRDNYRNSGGFRVFALAVHRAPLIAARYGDGVEAKQTRLQFAEFLE